MALLPVRHISVGIERPPADVYAFLAEPANFARWATGLGAALRPLGGDEWLAEGPEGPIRVRFSGRNAFGVVDHVLLPDEGEPVAAPMRVLANADGSEVVFSLFRRPGVDDAAFAHDAEWVARDLNRLRTLLESGEA